MMTSILYHIPGGRKYALEGDLLRALRLNIPVLALRVPARPSPRRERRLLRRAEAELRRSGTRTIIFSDSFPYKGYFLSRGFAGVTVDPVMTAKAGEIALMGAKKHDRAILCAYGADRNALRVFRSLAEGFRYVSVDVPPGSIGAFAAAGARMGLSVEHPREDTGLVSDAAVLLAPPSSPVLLSPRCILVRGCGGAGAVGGFAPERIEFSLPTELTFSPPPGVSPYLVLSLALSSGALGTEEVKILSVT